MKKMIVQRPPPEMQAKIERATEAVRNQKSRYISCPYCGHNNILVFQDARGHVQTKCKHCDQEVVVDVVNMRHLREPQ